MLKSSGSLRSVFILVLLLVSGTVSADWKTAVDAYQRKDWSMAIENLEEIVTAHPDYAPAQNFLGLSLFAEGRLDEAEAPLRRAVELQPEELEYSLGLAQFFLKKKDAVGAWEVLGKVEGSKIIAAKRKAFFGLYLPAAAQTEHYDEAACLIVGLLEADSTDAELWSKLGGLYRKMKEPEKAFAALKKASDLHPKDAEAARNALKAGMDAALSADQKEAKAVWKSVGELGERLCSLEESEENWKLAGEAWLGAKELSKALELFRKAQGERSSDPVLHYYVSLCLSGLNRFEEAKREVDLGIAAAKADPGLLKRLYRQAAYVADASHRYEDAIRWYEKLGDQEKVAEMQKKLHIQDTDPGPNDIDCKRTGRQIKGLKEQVQALKDLGDLRAAEQLENQLGFIEARYNRDCRE